MELDKAAFAQLLTGLVDAFERSELEEISRTGLGTNLSEFVPENAATRQTALKLIRRAESRDMVDELVVAARELAPTNRLLQELAIAYTLAVAPSPTLERIIEQDDSFDVVPWKERLGLLEGRVCSVEVPGGGGTGFLVAPDLVMTNHHVVAPIVDGGAAAGSVKLCFDYKTGPDGKTVKPPVEVGLADPWLLDSSPPSPLDEEPGAQGVPEDDQLDYALIALERPFGDEPLAGIESEGPPRGWIGVPHEADPPATGAVALILQHPRGDPLKLAGNVVTTLNGNGTRLRYKVDTDEGSSGSPVFDIHWNLVALHHSGDPDFSRDAAYNEGIPIGRIAALLRERGHAERLGALE